MHMPPYWSNTIYVHVVLYLAGCLREQVPNSSGGPPVHIAHVLSRPVAMHTTKQAH